MEIFIDLRDVVVYQSLVCLLIDDVHVRPLNLRSIFAAFRNIIRTIRCWNANFWRQRRHKLRRWYKWTDWRSGFRYFGCRIYKRLIHATAVERSNLFINRRLGWDWKRESNTKSGKLVTWLEILIENKQFEVWVESNRGDLNSFETEENNYWALKTFVWKFSRCSLSAAIGLFLFERQSATATNMSN